MIYKGFVIGISMCVEGKVISRKWFVVLCEYGKFTPPPLPHHPHHLQRPCSSFSWFVLGDHLRMVMSRRNQCAFVSRDGRRMMERWRFAFQHGCDVVGWGHGRGGWTWRDQACRLEFEVFAPCLRKFVRIYSHPHKNDLHIQEILNLQSQDVIQLHSALVQDTDTDETTNQSITFEKSLWIFVVKSKKLTGSTTNLW